MESLEIKNTPSSPSVSLNPETGVYAFAGRSLPEDPVEFYKPVMDWFDAYSNEPLTGVRFEFRLTYFNTASSKIFFSLFQIIDKINVDNPGAENKIVIYTNDDDEDLLELFEYYKELLSTDCLVLESY